MSERAGECLSCLLLLDQSPKYAHDVTFIVTFLGSFVSDEAAIAIAGRHRHVKLSLFLFRSSRVQFSLITGALPSYLQDQTPALGMWRGSESGGGG